MSVGRPPLETIRVYESGVMRLPSSLAVGENRIKVHWTKNKLSVSLASGGEVGIKPYLAPAAKSAVVGLRRVFRLMNIDPSTIAGEYTPTIRNGVFSIILRRSRARRNGDGH